MFTITHLVNNYLLLALVIRRSVFLYSYTVQEFYLRLRNIFSSAKELRYQAKFGNPRSRQIIVT